MYSQAEMPSWVDKKHGMLTKLCKCYDYICTLLNMRLNLIANEKNIYVNDRIVIFREDIGEKTNNHVTYANNYGKYLEHYKPECDILMVNYEAKESNITACVPTMVPVVVLNNAIKSIHANIQKLERKMNIYETDRSPMVYKNFVNI